MRRGVWLVAPCLLVACATGDPNLGTRLAADIDCVAQLALDGLTVYTNSRGVATAGDVSATIANAAELSMAAAVRCERTLSYIAADVAAMKAKAKRP